MPLEPRPTNKKTFLQSKDYFDKVWISSNRGNIVGFLAQEFSASLEQNYENPFSVVNNATVNFALQKVLGDEVSTVFDMDNMYTWTGSTPFQFSLPLIFIAEVNPIEELIGPVKDLLRMITPDDSKTAEGVKKDIVETAQNVGFNLTEEDLSEIRMLAPPSTPNSPISIRIGDVLDLDSCVIPSISMTFSPPYIKVGSSRLPSRIEIELTVQSINMMTYKAINQSIFPNQQR